ncbi:UNVERIFIED_CONTAM: hypothetical protein GTU68_001914, partial [Idotea baltica]|nr:hypothetical protein [Idotea baltica]
GEFPRNRLVGPIGDGGKSNDESVDPYFLLLSSGCWNGISLACMDLAKKHVTRKAHADVGMRVCDYPTIQDYFGNCVASTSVTRSHVFLVAQAMDKATNNNDWSLHSDLEFMQGQTSFIGFGLPSLPLPKMLTKYPIRCFTLAEALGTRLILVLNVYSEMQKLDG